MDTLRFRDRLERELAARKKKNPRYSLRGFARLLGADHATLSQMLRGRRAISASRIRNWGSRLGADREEIAAYVAAERLSEPDANVEQQLLRNWIAEAAAVTAQNEHYRLLELCRAPEFQADTRWLASRIGVSVDAVNLALSRLLRLRLIALDVDGTWRDTTMLAQLTPARFRELALSRVRKLAGKEVTDHAEPRDAISNPVEKPGRNGALLRGAVRLEGGRAKSSRLSTC